MVVQRHYLFADEPPLEPEVAFRFRQDGKVVFDATGSDMLTERFLEECIASAVV